MPRITSPAGKPYAPFAQCLRECRLRLGLTQGELAAAAEVNHSYLSRLENGDRKPSPRLLRKLAGVFKCSYESLAILAGLIEAREEGRSDLVLNSQLHSGGGVAVDRPPLATPSHAKRAIPLYDTVAAGIFKDTNVVQGTDDVAYLVLSEEELGYDPRAFALIVVGDSMVEAGILDGDVLVVSPGTRVVNGDIAVVSVMQQASTVKKIYFDQDQVLLQPCNSNFRPEIYDGKEIEILGKVILVRRKL